MADPVMLIEEANSRGTLYAVVEQDDRTAYFYLYPSELLANKYSPRPCWLRNLQPAPEKRDVKAMEEGMAPMLEARYCNHPEGKAPLEAERIRIVWMEEEDGAAVLYDDELMGVIPGWTMYSEERSVGYAADCIGSGEDSQMFPLGTAATNQLHKKVAGAIAFRDDWADETSQTWSIFQKQFLDTYEAILGPVEKYYAIDGGKWPPIGMARFERDDVVYFLTLGVSIRPMPWVEMLYNDHAEGFRRMELGMAISKKDFDEKTIMALAGMVSGLADRPWRQVTWLGEGHTISFSEMPAPYESLVLSSALYNGPSLEMPQMYNDPVNLYWVSPITKAERLHAHEQPNGGYMLLEKMIQEGINHIIQPRNPIVAG
ncbi:suppressor of fused domain protein [Chitinophaga qingshengii]|uniref:Suppressor of fused domain protein n=1 Tax=Chitinophaga qingshengii TaxID=1569794 RepID=A0ABR7TZF1_9BACT|nr:suppressor of fused domain protein [Chitinophaga qingshengii]MBC9934734.1 suppressor of fused domain protein [Chitinophaga qingshengii]